MKRTRKEASSDDMAWSNHLFFLSFCCLLAAVSATFSAWSSPSQNNSSACNVCIYSADPTKYPPKCFVCLNAVYPSALQACVNTTTMPSNISYSQANCIEKNCAINFPKPPAPDKTQQQIIASLPQKLAPFFSLLKKLNFDKLHKRSIPEEEEPSGNKINMQPYAGEGENKVLLTLSEMKDIYISQQVETYASEAMLQQIDYEDDY